MDGPAALILACALAAVCWLGLAGAILIRRLSARGRTRSGEHAAIADASAAERMSPRPSWEAAGTRALRALAVARAQGAGGTAQYRPTGTETAG